MLCAILEQITGVLLMGTIILIGLIVSVLIFMEIPKTIKLTRELEEERRKMS